MTNAIAEKETKSIKRKKVVPKKQLLAEEVEADPDPTLERKEEVEAVVREKEEEYLDLDAEAH